MLGCLYGSIGYGYGYGYGYLCSEFLSCHRRSSMAFSFFMGCQGFVTRRESGIWHFEPDTLRSWHVNFELTLFCLTTDRSYNWIPHLRENLSQQLVLNSSCLSVSFTWSVSTRAEARVASKPSSRRILTQQLPFCTAVLHLQLAIIHSQVSIKRNRDYLKPIISCRYYGACK